MPTEAVVGNRRPQAAAQAPFGSLDRWKPVARRPAWDAATPGPCCLRLGEAVTCCPPEAKQQLTVPPSLGHCWKVRAKTCCPPVPLATAVKSWALPHATPPVSAAAGESNKPGKSALRERAERSSYAGTLRQACCLPAPPHRHCWSRQFHTDRCHPDLQSKPQRPWSLSHRPWAKPR